MKYALKGIKVPKVYIPRGVKIVNQNAPMTVRQRKFATGQVRATKTFIKTK
jgi:hypothetical protein